jgi:hypothetical protein
MSRFEEFELKASEVVPGDRVLKHADNYGRVTMYLEPGALATKTSIAKNGDIGLQLVDLCGLNCVFTHAQDSLVVVAIDNGVWPIRAYRAAWEVIRRAVIAINEFFQSCVWTIKILLPKWLTRRS